MALSQQSKIFSAGFALLNFVFALLMMMSLDATFGGSLAFALVVSAITFLLSSMSLGVRDYMQQRAFVGKKSAAATTAAHQTRTVEIDLPYDAAFDLALEALKTLDNQTVPIAENVPIQLEALLPRKQRLKLRKIDRKTGSIQAGLRQRLLGIPDVLDFSRITIQVERIDATTTRLYLEGKAHMLWDNYDLGKNLHYVNTLALFLRRESQQHHAEKRLGEDEGSDTETAGDDSHDHNRADGKNNP
jgi:hypothetical protein